PTTFNKVSPPDGGVIWICRSIPQLRQDNKVTTVGERVLIPNDNRYYFECAAVKGDAKTGTGIPGAATKPALDSLIEDGNVTWQTKTAAGILSTTRITIRRCAFVYTMGCGIHFQAGGGEVPATGADSAFVSECDLVDTGAGVYIGGSD